MNTSEIKVTQQIQKLIQLHKSLPLLGSTETHFLLANNPHVFAFTRRNDKGEALLAINNFSEHTQTVDVKLLDHVGSNELMELVSQQKLNLDGQTISLQPYQVMWIVAR